MWEQDPADPSQFNAPYCQLPPIEGERRKEQDRRSAERQGKYDRRRNRCQHCLHFQEAVTTESGLCVLHQVPVNHDAFACPNFDPLISGESRKPIR